MPLMIHRTKLFFIFLSINFLFSCQDTTEKQQESIVRIHLKGNVNDLNIYTSPNAYLAEVVNPNVHASLLLPDPSSLELKPYLAINRPVIEMEGTSCRLQYEIRPEAKWEDGSDITGEDVLFTIKAICNPRVNAASTRSYLNMIEDVIIDPSNPRKFTIISNRAYFLLENSTGSLHVLPSYHYDPQGIMQQFNLSELNDAESLEEIEKDPLIKEFADQFNTQFGQDSERVKGAGPYNITQFSTHQYITLDKKEFWWGDRVDVDYIAAYPQKLMYKIIDDDNASIVALKEQEIDVMSYIPADQYISLKTNKKVSTNFQITATNGSVYQFVGLNAKNSILADLEVRKAITHLFDKEQLVDLQNGLSTPVFGPVVPIKSYYNDTLPKYTFDIERAAFILKAAGWEDKDGDGILEKVINGTERELTLEFLYPQGKAFYRDMARICKDNAKRVGMEIELNPSEWATMVEDLRQRNFDLAALAWSTSALPDDFKQIWHSESTSYDGSNFVNFSSLLADNLIDSIQVCMDESLRNHYYRSFQQEVVRQFPYVFLVSPKRCMAIHSRFKNANAEMTRPGYTARLFQLK